MDLLPKDLPLDQGVHAHAHDHGNAPEGTPRWLPFALGALVVVVAAFVLVTKTSLVAHASIGAVEGKAERDQEDPGPR